MASRARDICFRCKEGPKWIKARGLCESCYMTVKANGSLTMWPRMDEMKRRRKLDGYCHCYTPIPQRLVMWGAVQCLKCGKKLPDEH